MDIDNLRRNLIKITTEMKTLAAEFYTPDISNDRKREIVTRLKVLTPIKRKLNSELDAAIENMYDDIEENYIE